jgi:hypothetical protein
MNLLQNIDSQGFIRIIFGNKDLLASLSFGFAQLDLIFRINFQINFKIKVKGSGQECPLYTGLLST